MYISRLNIIEIPLRNLETRRDEDNDMKHHFQTGRQYIQIKLTAFTVRGKGD